LNGGFETFPTVETAARRSYGKEFRWNLWKNGSRRRTPTQHSTNGFRRWELIKMNHSKRDIERKVDDLDGGDGDGGDPLILNLTALGHEPGEPQPDRSDSPHPELTVQTWPEARPESFSIATPNTIPEPWRSLPVLFVHTCDNAEKYRMDHMEEDSSVVTACQLWEPLDEADLRAEAEIRQANGEPIPPLLEPYTE